MKPPKQDPAWREHILRLYQHDIQEMWDPTMAPHIYNSYHEDLRMYKKLAIQYAPSSILDVGCAQGTLALLLGEIGFKVYAADIRQVFLDYAKTRYEKGDIDFICADILDAPFRTESFDLIFANQIIEHLIDPIPLLKSLRAMLTDEGHLVMTTPNHAYFKNNLPSHQSLGNPKQYSKHHCSADGNDHFFSFTANEVGDLCKAAGFRNVTVDYYATPWITGHWKVRFLHRFLPVKIFRWLNALTLKIPYIKPYVSYQLIIAAEN
jgi:2-polyprenyl-3-methyl-5-hydroxy-6-metoxy-1,4-benzoquinol methylase